MKKIICMVLALVMVMGLSVTAMAEEPTSGKITITTNGQYSDPTGSDSTGKPGDSWNIAVPGGFTKINPSDENTDEVYYVEVEWNVTSTIEYKIGTKGYTWNLYDDATATTPHTDGAPVKSAGYESTVISGIYGMNVNENWMPFANTPHGFLIICIITLLICVITMLFLRKKKML